MVNKNSIPLATKPGEITNGTEQCGNEQNGSPVVLKPIDTPPTAANRQVSAPTRQAPGARR